jgi:thimet oligopeptidase
MRAATRFAASAAFCCFACVLSAQEIPASQPPVWSTRPDAAAFDKLENERFRAAERSIADMVAVRGPRTVENTLVPYGHAVRQLATANYLSTMV